jgi:Na+-transporting NADH:ubiquinone oxidoreductase subunit A
VDIRISRGLNIPIEGFFESSQVHSHPMGRFAIDLRPFSHLSISTPLDEGQRIPKQGIIAEESRSPYRIFSSPVEATVVQIVRGEKRKLLEIVLDPAAKSSPIDPQIDILDKSRSEILEIMRTTGLCTCFKARPFGLISSPERPPRSIFVQCLETAPFTPSAEMQLLGRERAFLTGLKLAKKLTNTTVHIITTPSSPFIKLAEELEVQVHTINPLHPASSPSLAIQKIDPIRSLNDTVWTANTIDIIQLGTYCLTGDLWVDKVIAIAGSQIPQRDRRYVRAYPGSSIAALLEQVSIVEPCRIVSGDPLTGEKVQKSEYLRQGHTTVSLLKEADGSSRAILPFVRLTSAQYTATDTYFQKKRRVFPFSTLQNGELRGIIDTSIYNKVLPLDILVIPLIKAIIGKDYDKALQYGLLEVVPEDFALADFICPSKICMMEIVRQGQLECLNYL